MKSKRLIHQTISFMLAALLLAVAGIRTWSDNAASVQQYAAQSKELAKAGKAQQASSPGEAKVSTLSLDAVITPAISFDFAYYFYLLPQPAWQYVTSTLAAAVSFEEPVYLVSYFHRIFGRFIVTNAP